MSDLELREGSSNAVPPIRVAIVGGGIGGLCLAHGLRRSGVPVSVYERTLVRDDWLQGYRIHINPHGARALHACLPPGLWDEFVATAGKPSSGFGFYTEQLDELLYLPESMINSDIDGLVGKHYSISRISLRQVLLSQMDDVVQFDKRFERFETQDNTVTLHFADGTSAACDVLVAADGANSAVRRQALPDARRIDTGVVAVAGKLALTDQTRAWLPERLRTSVSNIMPPKDSAMFIAVWEGDRKPAQRDDTETPGVPGLLLDNTRDYLFWAYAAKKDTYPSALLDTPDGSALREFVGAKISTWHQDLRRAVAESDPDTINPVVMRSMAPVKPWPSTRVTLLGDAIHNMTPMAGIGANTALRDASLLRDGLVSAASGGNDLPAAIHDYERRMLDYGFAAVKLSRRNAKQATSGSSLARSGFKLVLRTTNAIPPMKRQFARQIGS